jgi:hypothetical protein
MSLRGAERRSNPGFMRLLRTDLIGTRNDDATTCSASTIDKKVIKIEENVTYASSNWTGHIRKTMA